MNHFFILPEEVQNGAWEELRWSGDLVTIKEEEAQNEP